MTPLHRGSGRRKGSAKRGAASVDAVEPPGRSSPLEKIQVRFQRGGTPERWRALGEIRELQVSQDLLDDARVVDETDGAQAAGAAVFAASLSAIYRARTLYFFPNTYQNPFSLGPGESIGLLGLAKMRRAIQYLSRFCAEHLIEKKYLIVPSYQIGHQIGETLANEGRSWVNQNSFYAEAVLRKLQSLPDKERRLNIFIMTKLTALIRSSTLFTPQECSVEVSVAIKTC